MPGTQLTISRGAAVVFEGLDRTGKSTQLDMLRAAVPRETTVFVHMPSGFVPFTRRVYDALEAAEEAPSSGLAQQLAHLACHAESAPRLAAATDTGALVLDRWWWSTLAYGWYGGSIEQAGISEENFRALIRAVWAPVTPSVVFVFLEPHHLDSNNSQGVEAGYRQLVGAHPELAVVVPSGTPESTHDFIVSELIARGLASRN